MGRFDGSLEKEPSPFCSKGKNKKIFE